MMKRTVLIPQEICSITIMQRKVHAAQRLDTDVAAMEIGFTAALTACELVTHPVSNRGRKSLGWYGGSTILLLN